MLTAFATCPFSRKSAISCADAQTKLHNKLIALECLDTCYENIVYTVPCFFDAGDSHYHVSGYAQYKCRICN